MTHNDDLCTGLQALYHLAREIFIVPQIFSYPNLTSLFPSHPKWKANSLFTPIYSLWSDDTAHMLDSVSCVFVFIFTPSPCIYFSICQKYHILSCLLLLLFSRGEKGRQKQISNPRQVRFLVFTLAPFQRSVGTVFKSFSTIIQVIGLYQ